MGKKYTQSVGSRWHRTASGQVERCYEPHQKCRQSHFATEAEAAERLFRPRNSRQSAGTFEVSISLVEDGIERSTKSHPPRLRTFSERYRNIFETTAEKAHSPTGNFAIDFGFSRKLSVKREPVRSGSTATASHYSIIYWEDNISYEYDSSQLTSSDSKPRSSYIALQNKLQRYFNEAATARILDIADEFLLSAEAAQLKSVDHMKSVNRAYNEIMLAIDSIEILSRGIGPAHQGCGIDLFNHNDVSELGLVANYNSSTLQPCDIVKSLKMHATEDPFVHSVSLHISEITDKNGSEWAISRIPEGKWYFSYSAGRETFCHEVSQKSIPAVTNMIDIVLSVGGGNQQARLCRENFVHQLLTVVEPAIRSYERTVEARLEMGEPSTTPATPVPESTAIKRRRIIRKSRRRSLNRSLTLAVAGFAGMVFGLFAEQWNVLAQGSLTAGLLRLTGLIVVMGGMMALLFNAARAAVEVRRDKQTEKVHAEETAIKIAQNELRWRALEAVKRYHLTPQTRDMLLCNAETMCIVTSEENHFTGSELELRASQGATVDTRLTTPLPHAVGTRASAGLLGDGYMTSSTAIVAPAGIYILGDPTDILDYEPAMRGAWQAQMADRGDDQAAIIHISGYSIFILKTVAGSVYIDSMDREYYSSSGYIGLFPVSLHKRIELDNDVTESGGFLICFNADKEVLWNDAVLHFGDRLFLEATLGQAS